MHGDTTHTHHEPSHIEWAISSSEQKISLAASSRSKTVSLLEWWISWWTKGTDGLRCLRVGLL